MSKQYYTLIQCVDGKWQPEFGDYDRKVVVQERLDRLDGHDALKSADLKVLKSEHTQVMVGAALAAYNAEHRRLSDQELPIAAALFARSNMGMIGVHDRQFVENHVCLMLNDPITYTLKEAVMRMCGHYAESDEQEETFVAEAKNWMKELRKREVSYIRRVHPDMAAMLCLIVKE